MAARWETRGNCFRLSAKAISDPLRQFGRLADVRRRRHVEQALAIGGLLVNDRVVSAVIHVVLGAPQHPWTFWWAPLLGMLLWAPLHFALDALRLRRRT